MLAFGGVVALLNGCVFPSIAFVFAEMLTLFYSHDTDHIMDYAMVFGGIFVGVAIASWVLSGIQGGVFAIVGERLTTRLRVHLFRSILRQDVAFFDDPANSVGALTANLRTDTSLVRSATGQSLGSAVQTFGSLVFGMTVAMMASWKYGLVLIAAVPILAVGEAINMANLASGDAAVSASMGASAALVSEISSMIREVKAFGMERRMYRSYDALLNVPRKEERDKALLGAAAFGTAQGMTMLFYAFAFWWGSWLIAERQLDFYDFMKSLWALGFCAAGAGQAAAFAGDASAAAVAARRIFSSSTACPRSTRSRSSTAPPARSTPGWRFARFPNPPRRRDAAEARWAPSSTISKARSSSGASGSRTRSARPRSSAGSTSSRAQARPSL